MLAKMRQFLKDLWLLTRPYWYSEERWAARGLLAVIVALNLGLVWVSVLINRWQNDFYNTLEGRDLPGFKYQLAKFSLLAAAYIVVAVYQLYLNQMLQIRWRRWLTDHYLGRWIGERTYYRIQLADRTTDNPDQRIADDLALFVDKTLNLTLGLLSSVVTLVSFVVILWGLSGTLEFELAGVAVTVPGYMVWVALVYAIAGTWLIHVIGRPLVPLNFSQQKLEADFRFSLVRFRENAEAIALYRGEDDEIRGLRRRFGAVFDNWWEIMKRTKKLMWFRSGYNQIAIIFPILVAAPRFFSGALPLGGLMQTSSAFGQVQDALSWFVNSYTQLAEWKATVDRLTTFHDAMTRARAAGHAGGLAAHASGGVAYALQDARIDLPDGTPLIAPPATEIAPGAPVLVTGASGAGKSTLFRALAGIWPFGRGRVLQPAGARALFLPQKPYLTVGTLREQIAYPADVAEFTDDGMREALAAVGLPHFADRLDESRHWALALSGGEQQRIAIARALVNRPQWLFLDEATSALDEASERKLYALLARQLPDTTLVSIGHRATLQALHPRRLEVRREPGAAGTLQWTAA